MNAALLAVTLTLAGQADVAYDGKTIPQWAEAAAKARADATRSDCIAILRGIARDGKYGPEGEAELIAACQKCFKLSRNTRDRNNLIEMAKSLKSPSLVEPVAECLLMQEVDGAAIRALEEIGDPKAVPALIRYAGDARRFYRIDAYQALGAIGTGDTLKALDKLHPREKDRNVKESILRAMDVIEARIEAEKAEK